MAFVTYEELEQDQRACQRPGCGHEGKDHAHWRRQDLGRKLPTFCGLCRCGEWQPPHSGNTGFIGIFRIMARRARDLPGRFR